MIRKELQEVCKQYDALADKCFSAAKAIPVEALVDIYSSGAFVNKDLVQSAFNKYQACNVDSLLLQESVLHQQLESFINDFSHEEMELVLPVVSKMAKATDILLTKVHMFDDLLGKIVQACKQMLPDKESLDDRDLL
jgi:hypothetical protein